MHTKLIKAPMRRSRRRYTEEFKKQAIEACLQPGVSMASVALANGLNANLLRRWVIERQEAVAGRVTLPDQHPLEITDQPVLAGVCFTNQHFLGSELAHLRRAKLVCTGIEIVRPE